MKGSPILATALACLIMLSMYVGMRLVFSQDNNPANDAVAQTGASEQAALTTVTAYADIYFSAQPESLTISHPATDTPLLTLSELDEFEWSGEIQLPKDLTEELEILCKVKWAVPQAGYQFIELTLSPDGLENQSQTLRAEGDIADIMNFHWKEAASE